MKVFKFDYVKKDGSKSEREVMSLHANSGYMDGIDLEKLNDTERAELTNIQLKYEKALKPFIKKGFRRFSESGMTIMHEETIK